MTARTEKMGSGTRSRKGCRGWTPSPRRWSRRSSQSLDRTRRAVRATSSTAPGSATHCTRQSSPCRSASWSASMVFDLMGEERAADLTLGLGLVGAVGAAVTGAAQWQDATNEEAPRRLGALHALLNVAATGLMAGSWLLRQQGRRGSGVTLSTLGLGVNLASAWLGGELAYELGIGVNHAAFQKPPSDWTDVAALDDLSDGTPHRVEADGTPVLLLRQGRSDPGDRRHVSPSWRSAGRGADRRGHGHLSMARVGLQP